MRIPRLTWGLQNSRIGGTDATGYVPPGAFASGPGDYLPDFTPLLNFSPQDPLQTWKQEIPYAFGIKMWEVMPDVFLGTPDILVAPGQVSQVGGGGNYGGVSPSQATQPPTGTTRSISLSQLGGG